MTPAEEALYRRIRRRAASTRPDLYRRFLAAYRLIRDVLTEPELVRYLASGRVEELVVVLLSDEEIDPAFQPLRTLLDRTVLDAAAFAARREPPAEVRPPAFDFLNPRVVDAARDLDTRVVEGLKAELRETVRQRAIAGLEEGKNPHSVARGIRGVLELAPNQEQAVRNFEQLLREGDREALTRALRDRRFDRTLRKALGRGGTGLSEDQVQRMTAAYRRRMVAWNAETHARSMALDAQRLGQRLSWEDAISRGVVEETRLRRRWVDSDDSRVRPEHEEMDGTVVRWRERYPNGQLVPGETDYNCRCIERIYVIPAVAVAA